MGADREGDAMTDLTTRQLIDTIVRSLNETGKRMAAKYKGAAAEQPAPEPRVRKRKGARAERRKGTTSGSSRRA